MMSLIEIIYENDYGFLQKMSYRYNYVSKMIMIDWDCEKIEIMKMIYMEVVRMNVRLKCRKYEKL